MILHEQAECFKGCTDELCPYIHNEFWAIYDPLNRFVERYTNKDDAIAKHRILFCNEV